jgi:hypothetical protein
VRHFWLSFRYPRFFVWRVGCREFRLTYLLWGLVVFHWELYGVPYAFRKWRPRRFVRLNTWNNAYRARLAESIIGEMKREGTW